MRFRLLYDGQLKSNGDSAHKHDLRRHFHKQLQVLIERPPFVDFHKNLTAKGSKLVFYKVDQFTFVPIVSESVQHTVELDILLLGHGEPGQVITPGGDVDNRLKTLFDAFRMPKDKSELPKGVSPDSDEQPNFYCLLEDDKLVSGLSVKIDRLLRPKVHDTEVVLIIDVLPVSSRSSIPPFYYT